MIRSTLVFAIFCLIFTFIVSRLFYWQLVVGSNLAQAAADQYFFTLHISPTRGTIITSDGSPLVSNKTAYLVYAEPKKIENRDDWIERVAEILELDNVVLEENISQSNIVWVPLKHKVDEDVYQKIKALNLTGLGVEKEGKRLYPEASMAAQLMGFVGSDERGDDKGYFGLEGFYDRALKGKPGSLIQEKDARGLPILLGAVKRIPAADGQGLQLHLDRTVQFIIETNLKNGLDRYGAKGGLVAVMDPYTGGILGSASFPTYDPTQYSIFDQSLYPNPLIAQNYEPGSTFKTLVMAAAVNERLVDTKTIFNEDGPVEIGEYVIRTWNNEYHGELTMTQILEKSSNTGMVFVGRKLGREKLDQYLRNFGLGEVIGIDLEEEETSELRSLPEWKEIDLATASFGQGIAVTPIQMLTSITAIANGGKLVQPQVVKAIIDSNGHAIEVKPKIVREVLRSTTTKVITEMLISAVDNGEAKWAKPKGYRIAGKTGTAQIPVEGHYDADKTIASFVGYAPADNPKFVMLVLLREPSSSPWGSETAAPLFFTIAKELFAYYGISPKG